jgi:hypothetical protein
VDNPSCRSDAGMQLYGHLWKRNMHDRDIEDTDEIADTGRQKYEPGTQLRTILAHHSCCFSCLLQKMAQKAPSIHGGDEWAYH